MGIPFEQGELVETFAVIASSSGTYGSWRIVKVIDIDEKKNRVQVKGGDAVVKDFTSWVEYSPHWFRHLQN